MVAPEKSLRFGCLLVASLFVLVLSGCGEDSESGSSQRAQPSTNSKPTETAESHATGGEPADCKPTQPDMLGTFLRARRACADERRQRVCTLRENAGRRRLQA